MASQTALKLPLVDFSLSDLKVGSSHWDFVKGQVIEALELYGCFEASFVKIPLELRQAIFGTIEELCDLPLQAKLGNISKKPFHGYLGQIPDAPLYESIGIDDVDIDGNVEALTNTLWPDGNQNFTKTMKSFSKQLPELDQMIRRMILESLNLDKYMDEHMHSTNYLLRLIKYEGPKTTETETGLNSHVDKSVLSILLDNEVEGLQVQTKEGEWINATPSKDSFVVMIGESLYAWLNGRFRIPPHRVMMIGDKTRYSVGFFSFPKEGYIVKAPEELVDEEHPLLFKPFDYVQFMKFYQSKAGRKAESPLKAYCGVQN